MAMEFAPSNKMMTEAPEKKEFHFSGDGIWRNKAILAETREEAEKIWHSVKLIFDTSNRQGIDRERESALERRRGTTLGVRLAESGQAAGS